MNIKITLIPRASQCKLIKLEDGAYKAWVTAAPVDGKANEALVRLISDVFGVPKSKIAIVQGLKSKKKIIEISNK